MKLILGIDLEKLKSKDELLTLVDVCLAHNFVDDWECVEDIFSMNALEGKFKRITDSEKVKEEDS